MRAPTILVILLATMLAALARADDAGAEATMTGAAAADILLATDGFQISLPGGQFEAIAEAVERDVAATPDNARLQLAMALVQMIRGEHKSAREHAERATKLDPKSAEAFYRLGNIVFAGIGEAGLLDKASLAGKGRKAYEAAVELDSNHVGARYGLAQFYMGAPGIAGGSDKKAREQADALLAIDGGAFFGNMVVAQLAASDKEWDAMERAFDAASNVAASENHRQWALRSWAWALIDSKKDPQAALAVLDRWQSSATPDDPNEAFVRGRALKDLGRPAEAAEQFRVVLAARPQSANGRVALAEALEAAGDKAGALSEFETFLAEHPDDKRAGDAKKAVKRLKKALAAK